MKTAPLVSIVLPTYNRPQDVRETLLQIRANVAVPHEVLILDNSEKPTNPELLPDERCLFLGRNEGTAARNRGIQNAAAPYLLMLDDDSHPLPGAVEKALAALHRAPPGVAGLLGNIRRQDGAPESALLPTTLLGCGVLFRRDVLRCLPFAYPDRFCLYGEEYWVTLALYRSGFHLEPCRELRIVHRASGVNRDQARTFYYLGRNNAVVWQQFTPSRYLVQVLDDTSRRYEYIADRENVREAFDRGVANALTPSWPVTPLPVDRFRAFSLLDRMEAAAGQCSASRGAVLCGTGKFPGLWAKALRAQGIGQVIVADFNPALIGRAFSGWDVLAPKVAVALGRLGYTFVTGHAATADTLRWRSLLACHGVDPADVIDVSGESCPAAEEEVLQVA